MRRSIAFLIALAVAAVPSLAQDRGDRSADNPIFEDPEYGFRIAKVPRSRDWQFLTDNQSENGLRVRIINDAKGQPHFIDVYVQIPDVQNTSGVFDLERVCDQMLREMQGNTDQFRELVQRRRERAPRAIPGESNCYEMVLEGKLANQEQTEFEWHWYIFQSSRNQTLVRIGVLTRRGEFAPNGRPDPEMQYILRSFQAFQRRPRREGGR